LLKFPKDRPDLKVMLLKVLCGALLAANFASAQLDTEVVAVFLIGRHGDRTSKVLGNTQLTTLGKNQVYETATYFRDRYLNTSSPNLIQGVDTDYLYNQIYAAAP
jgi:hypothetical protein